MKYSFLECNNSPLPVVSANVIAYITQFGKVLDSFLGFLLSKMDVSQQHLSETDSIPTQVVVVNVRNGLDLFIFFKLLLQPGHENVFEFQHEKALDLFVQRFDFFLL